MTFLHSAGLLESGKKKNTTEKNGKEQKGRGELGVRKEERRNRKGRRLMSLSQQLNMLD